MPAVFLRFPDLQRGGPTVQVQITLAAKSVKGRRPSTRTLPLTALIDTGSSATVLKRGLPAFLGLKPTSNTYVHTASSINVLCDEFAVSLILPQGFKVRTPPWNSRLTPRVLTA